MEAPPTDQVRAEAGQFTADALQSFYLGLTQESLDRLREDRISRDRLEPKVLVVTATANDVDLKGASVVHVSSGTVTLSGFIAPSPNKARLVIIYNSSGNNLTLKNEATSATANQITCKSGADTTIATKNGTVLVYLSSKWKQVV